VAAVTPAPAAGGAARAEGRACAGIAIGSAARTIRRYCWTRGSLITGAKGRLASRCRTMAAVTSAPSAGGAAATKGGAGAGIAVGTAASAVRRHYWTSGLVARAEGRLASCCRAMAAITSTPSAGGAAVTKGGAGACVAVGAAASAVRRDCRASNLSTAAKCLNKS
jgi:hypothetical protein